MKIKGSLSWRFAKAIVILSYVCSATITFAGQAPNWKADWDATVRAAEKEGPLVIYGPRGRDQEILYSEIFPKAFPKIRVQYTPGRLSQMISRLMAEQRAGVRQVDLLLGGTDVLLGTFKDKGLLQPIRPLLVLPEVLDPAAWFKGKLLFADSEEKFIALFRAVPYSSACINTNLIKPGELKSYLDFVNPKWKGKIASQDFSSGSARNQMFVLYVREDLGPKYLKRLISEMDITFSRNVVQLGDWLAQGKFAIALGRRRLPRPRAQRLAGQADLSGGHCRSGRRQRSGFDAGERAAPQRVEGISQLASEPGRPDGVSEADQGKLVTHRYPQGWHRRSRPHARPETRISFYGLRGA